MLGSEIICASILLFHHLMPYSKPNTQAMHNNCSLEVHGNSEIGTSEILGSWVIHKSQ
jgi:hypothetical protein